MHTNFLSGINFQQVGNTLLKLWLAMCSYLVLAWWWTTSLTDDIPNPSLLQTIVTWTIYFWLPWVVLLPLVQKFLSRVPFMSTRRRRATRVYFAWLLMLLIIHALLIVLIQLLRDLMFSDALNNYGAVLNGFLVQQGFALFDAGVFAMLAAGNSFRSLQDRLRAEEVDAFRLSRSLTDSRLQSLKMQLNPHFLFNSLNGVSVLIDKNENAQAREMLGELSSFLRQTLRNPREKWVSLDKELEFVKMYLRIEQFRFGKRLTYFEECEPLALAAKVPPMLLQPLFENAIVHGLSNKQGPCRLSFECRLYDRYLIILIFDNGENFEEISDPLHKGGIGLSNIQDRLREVYGENYALGIEKKPDGTLVTLKLPAYKDSQF